MRSRTGWFTLTTLVLGSTGTLRAQVENPIPDPLVTRDLAVEIREIARLGNADLVVPPQDLALSPLSEAWLESSAPREAHKNLDVLRGARDGSAPRVRSTSRPSR